uniref:Secreted protein n=1 Tax=Mus musculus TaxID=10090 RepID=Q3UF02_MOUSE|nr:unnamed protein product [Mus musculus]
MCRLLVLAWRAAASSIVSVACCDSMSSVCVCVCVSCKGSCELSILVTSNFAMM